MNKNINEIAIKTMHIVINGADPNGDVDKMYIPAVFAQKFAELIVQECATFCESKNSFLLAKMLKDEFGF